MDMLKQKFDISFDRSLVEKTNAMVAEARGLCQMLQHEAIRNFSLVSDSN